ncbi:MAG: hypothetical protein LBM73_00860 [Candidatus Nomurabacteria bacterium]|nr:hypothetical protein [Candidatus Nomurabacteria bacterium]
MGVIVSSMAINLVAGKQSNDESIIHYEQSDIAIPTQATFHAKTYPPLSSPRSAATTPIITGAHSSDDFFETILARMSQDDERLPWLAKIIRAYGVRPWSNVRQMLETNND